jgi:putative heme-binding domain-containing protein
MVVLASAYGFDYTSTSEQSEHFGSRAPDGAPWLEWSPGVARFAWRMHPEVLVSEFLARARSASLDITARVQSLEALAFCRSREAAEAMLTLALAGPADTRELAAWWVKHNDLYDWRESGLARHLETRHEWTDDQIVWRSGPVTRGSVPVDVDVSGSRRIALVVTESDNGNGYDWADWLMPQLRPFELVLAPSHELAVIYSDGRPQWLSATAGWGSVQVGSNCAGGPLIVDGLVMPGGIGTHAPSTIVFELPPHGPSLLRFVATAAVDDSGTQQPGSSTKVEFLVYADRAAAREAEAAAVVAERAARLDTLRSPAAPLDTRLAAAESLAVDPAGGALLLAEASSGRLAALSPDDARDELLAAISESIFRNPDLGIRALASEHFTRPGTPTLPPIADLAAAAGDRRAGQALFFGAARCDACHAVRGRGGDVGPDLSAIGAKLGRPELLDAILNPSAAIGAGFESLTLTLRDGRVLAGLLQADGPTLLLKDGNGARHVLDAAEVVERRKSRLSLMPEDSARALSPQQLADLCAFLQHDPDAPPTLGPPLALWNGRDLSGWAAVPDASAWSVREADGAPVLHCAGQPIGYIRCERAFTSFELTVEWRFPDPSRPGNSGVLLRVQPPDGVWPRSLEAQLNSGDAGDIWNIGEFGAELDPSRTQGRRTVKLLPSSERPLGEWNTYRITLRSGDLTLEVNGQVQNRGRWCEELAGGIALQSEGAPIEFRRVELREIGN